MHHPEVPAFDSQLLDSIAAAIARRAKSLKYGTASFACSRDAESAGEVLRLEIDSLEARRTQLRVMIWQDGHLWLGIHRPNPRREAGWEIALERSGSVRELDPLEIAKMIERTLSAVHGGSGGPDAADQVEGIWRTARLQRDG